jgi:hypothetical protein
VVYSSGCGVYGVGCRVSGLWFMADGYSFGFRVKGYECWVQGLGSGGWDLEFSVLGVPG